MNGERYGQPWEADELDLIVADYFEMLAYELSGTSYVKAKHCAVLMDRIGRSHRSVEFKHQNISAVLNEMGLPWIKGYIPKQNYQNSIFDAIDRHLSQNSGAFGFDPQLPPEVPQLSEVFVAPPHLRTQEKSLPERLQRLVRKSTLSSEMRAIAH